MVLDCFMFRIVEPEQNAATVFLVLQDAAAA
jgi:hypothetical protein